MIKEAKLIHIYDNESVTHTQDGYDIAVIYPTFYWYEILDIPTKRIQKAKKIANNILSDRPKHYTDIVLFSKEGRYAVYCFDKKSIENILKQKGSKDTKIYFLDSIGIDTPVMLPNETVALPFGEKLLINAPQDGSNAIGIKEYMQSHPLPKPLFTVDIDHDRSYGWLVAACVVFGLFGGVYLYERYSVLQSIKTLQENMDDGGRSGYEIDSLIKSYEDKQKNKEAFLDQLKTTLENDTTIKQLHYDGTKIQVQ